MQGCNGTSGENGDDPFGNGTVTPPASPTITLQVLDGSCTNLTNRTNLGDNLCLQASVALDGVAQANEIVEFSTTIGSLSVASSLTNAQGVASTTFVPDNRIGAGTIMGTVTLDGELIAASQNFEVLPADAVDEDIVRIGAFENGSFVEGALGLDGFELTEDVSLSAGGTLGLTVALVDSADQPVSLSLPVSFSTACQTAGNAKIDQTVIAANGIARSTYKDLSCAGANGNNDVITASINVNGQQTTVSRVLSIQPEAAGSVKFVSAEPSNIVLSGTGGQNTDSVSTVTFQVDSALGNPLAQQQVSFSLNTEIGGLSLSPVQALTNSDGQVSTRVTAGSVPTSVRVTANTQGEVV